MKRRDRRSPQDSSSSSQMEKVGWIRKFCGRGMFRELWKNRFIILRGEHLYICDREVKDERKAQEVFNMCDYDRSEELRKDKSRSKKNHSRFTVVRRRRPGNTVPNLVFLALSPEEKESWVNALNVAIFRARNRVLDQVTVDEDSVLVHPTRDRVKIPHSRRLPSRGHLLSVGSSHGTLMLDLVAEEDFPDGSLESWENSFRVDLQDGPSAARTVGGRQRAGTDVSKLRAPPKEAKVKTSSLPRGSERSWGKNQDTSKVQKAPQVQVIQTQSRTPQPGKKSSPRGRSRCASMDEVLSSRPHLIRSELRSALRGREAGEEESVGGAPVGQLQSLIAQRMQRAQELLEELRLQELQKAKVDRERGGGSPYLKSVDSPRLHHLKECESPRVRGRKGRSKGSSSPRPTHASRSPSSSFRAEPSACDSTPHGQQAPPPPQEQEVDSRRAEAERLLQEAVSSWKEAQEVLQEVKELQSRTLRRKRRAAYQEMTSAVEGSDTAGSDTPASPTSPEDEGQSETP